MKIVQEDQRNTPMEGSGSSNSDSFSLWEPSQTKNRLFVNRLKVVKQKDGYKEEDCYAGIADLFDGVVYSKLSAFQRRVNRVLKVGHINNVAREAIMKGRIIGCATNKYIKFVADTGSPVVIVPHSMAVSNKLEILPTDKDEPSYAGVTGMKLSLVGQCTM